MGRPFRVPDTLNIMKAMEYAGYQIIRGAGCRGGYCGGCSTVFRRKNNYFLFGGLACQTLVEEGMHISLLPFTVSEKTRYDISQLSADSTLLLKLYPTIARCVACNTCTKACPQELNVMDYVQASLRGNLQTVSDLSFDCIHCGLCALRCPAMIIPHHVGQLARRLYGAHVQPRSPGISSMLTRIAAKEFDQEIDEMVHMELETLQKKYTNRQLISEE